ncbi:hypothetical protein HNP82_001962 [Catenibacillus scindens]|uniref:Glycosyltransferase 2-like domain-containing protein n=1 Tax=Catenibacillus scindens TaxID=673271 RepID=A0A7W8HAM3_9FIRM|nr:glycosyltransferase family 2 protein [Catenibacillus scindens]MBB5264823.1 hypothetical protein [Catenibacillus scindens]
MEEKITGSIVTYNNEKTILECVESILDHTKNCDFQLYIYDNRSTDQTVPLLRRHFPQVKIIEGKENIGFGQGHNQIIRRVHSDFHAVINPDIFFKSNVILQMVRYMEEHPEVVQLTPMIRNLDGTIQYLPKRDPNFKFVVLSKLPFLKHYRRIYTMEDTVMIRPAKVMSCTGCFSVIRTSVLKKVHGYDRRFFMYFEDADLSRRLRAYGDLVYHPGMHVYHTWKRDNTKSMKGVCIFLRSMVKYYRKWR